MRALLDLGFCHFDGMGGMQPINHTEMAAFVSNTRQSWSPDDFRTVVSMSRLYITGRQEGVDIFSIAPSDRQGAEI